MIPKHLKTREFLYLLTLFFYIFLRVLDASKLRLGIIDSIYDYAVILVSAWLFFVEHRMKLRELIGMFCICIVFGLAAFYSKRGFILSGACFLLNADCTNFKRISKTALIALVSSVLLVVLMSQIGIIEDTLSHRRGITIHYFGFGYYSQMPFYMFYATLCYMYVRRDKLTVAELLLCIAVNGMIYALTSLRLTLYLTIGVSVMYLVLYKYKLVDISKKAFRVIAVIAYPIVAALSIGIGYAYDKNNTAMYMLNRLLSQRLRLSAEGVQRYPITPFGQEIVTTAADAGENYFYIDSGYLYALLGYGLVFLIVVLIMYGRIYWLSCVYHDEMLFIWITAVLLFSAVNNTWVTISTNPVLLALPGLMKKYHQKRKNAALRRRINRLYRYNPS